MQNWILHRVFEKTDGEVGEKLLNLKVSLFSRRTILQERLY